MRNRLVILSIAAVIYFAVRQHDPRHGSIAHRDHSPASTESSMASDWVDGGQVQGEGTVIQLLADDHQGIRHQKFILRLSSGQTVLVAHNIDLARKVESLRVGDLVMFSGEFAANPQGGVIHWTHRDPSGRHPTGWLKHRGTTYQ